MTNKKQTRATIPPMDLDLDSFLQTHSSSDDDDDDRIPHRTVDEILNDSDSSSSSSPSSPTSSLNRAYLRHKPSPHDNDNLKLKSSPDSSPNPSPSRKDDEDASVSSQETTTEALKTTTPDRTASNKVTSSKPGEFLGRDAFSLARRFSLLGGIRSNAKPGAALAAAAAASRSVPTPHAAAIKSRRAAATTTTTTAITTTTTHEGLLHAVQESDAAVGAGDTGNISDMDEFHFSHVDTATAANATDSASRVDAINEAALASDAGHLLLDNSADVVLFDPMMPSSSSSVERRTFMTEEGLNSDENADTSAESSVAFEDKIAEPCCGELNASRADPNSTSSVAAGFAEQGGPYAHEDGEIDGSSSAATAFATGEPVPKDGEMSVAAADDAIELVEEMMVEWESKRDNNRVAKKSRPSMKPLELAEELEKKHASTGLHWEEGAAAQPMRLEGVRRGSIALGYLDISSSNTITRTISSAFKRDHGSPQVLAVHSNFIAVGFSKGIVVVLPSKYSAQSPDNMEGKMLMLGLHGDKSAASVTSMCFNQQGDLLLAGYGDGHVTVWDLQRAVAAKVISGEHTAPVVHTLFLGQDSQVTRQFKAVTGDSKGLVLLHAFSVVPLLNRFSIKTQCLLDGQKTGIVLSASPLLLDDFLGGSLFVSPANTPSASGIGSMMGGVVGGDAGWKLFSEGSSLVEEGVVIFATHQTALVVRLSPSVEVYAQLSKPDGVREGSMPYTAWKNVTQAHGSSAEGASAEASERVSLLAIAWDRKVQVAKLVKSALKVYGKWTLDSAAIGVAWLDDQMLVVLTLVGQLCLFTKDGSLIHQTSFSLDGYKGDDLVAYHTYFTNIFGNPEKAYHNCVAVRGATIYVLGPMHLIVSRLLPWKERIQVLRKSGDWMGALNMAMTLFDGNAHGVIDLPRSVDAVQEAIMPYLVELLLAYVDEVFSYISVAFCNQIGKLEQLDEPKSRSSSVHSEIKEQFTRVGGVAVEFCVHIKRTDILFDEIFSKFVAVQQRDTFLELLEPYILKDMLGSLPPEIMQALVEHYSSKGWLQRVEQCVLHMDISSLDFNQVVRLCREHGLYGALIYLFNQGLDDFKAPLEELLAVFQNSQKESAATLGYRMLVYLKYCFSGLAFPPGHGTISPMRLPSLRTELVQFLLEDSDVLMPEAARSLSSSKTCFNLYHLLELDTEASLDVLKCAFPEIDAINIDLDLPGSESLVRAEKGDDSLVESQNLLVQSTINALICVLDMATSQMDKPSGGDDIGLVEVWPSKKDIGHIFEFIASFVASKRATISKQVLNQVLEYLTSETIISTSASALNSNTLKIREKQVLALLEVVPETDWDASFVLNLCERAKFYQVCGFIHMLRRQYLSALDSFMNDVDEPISAFSFINNILQKLNNNEFDTFRSAVISRIPELVNLCREGAFLMIIDHFYKESCQILSELGSHPKSLFLYLKTAIEVHLSGTLDFACLTHGAMGGVLREPTVKKNFNALESYMEKISNFPKFLRDNPTLVTDEMIELYLELLCQYESNSVLKFLETFENYRVEHCLRLCQEYGIVDAAAFLLERVGDVGSALSLTLSGLSDKFFQLETVIGGMLPDGALSYSTNMELFTRILRTKEVGDILNILHTCVSLCQRNTPRLESQESESLWFWLLDSFCEPLMDPCDEHNISGGMSVGIVHMSRGALKNELETRKKWKISKSQIGAPILKKLFSQFIKEIVEGMIGYVRLPTIMSKLLTDNGSQEFGDFKLTILGMLGTYGFERRILDTAKSLIEDDTYYTMSLLKKGASHAYAPQSLICCICNCHFNKNSPNSSIRVFSCGHATHLQCELQEKEAPSRGSLAGCPVCMPKKNSLRSKTKSALPENGLVDKPLSRTHKVHGTSSLQVHESDALESPYGLHHVSRFEILANLQKDQKLVQIENLPLLRLAPPAIYHEKVKKGSELSTAESSSGLAKLEKPAKHKQLKELKMKGSSMRFPLKSTIFGKERMAKR